MAATVVGAVHLFGGYLAGGDPSTAAFRLEPGGWRVLAPLPEGRAAGTAVPVGGSVYLAGGIGPDGLARQMLVYDATADRWSTAPGPPTPREHLGGAGLGGLVYTVGGRAGGVNRHPGRVRGVRPGDRRRGAGCPTCRPRGAAWPPRRSARATWSPSAERHRPPFQRPRRTTCRPAGGRALPPLPTPRHGLGVTAVGTTLHTLAGGPQPGLHVSAVAEAIDMAPLGPCATP